MRMNHFVARLAAGASLLAAAHAGAGINQWSVKGPPGGDTIRDLEASSTNPDVYYVSYNRLLARSTDGAVTWQDIGKFTGEITDIAVDPTDGNRIYVAVLEEGVFRSDDAGDTFVQIAPSIEMPWSVGVGGTDGRTVYYGTNYRNVYQSTDRGATWTLKSSNGPQVFSRLLVEGADGNTVIGINSWAYRSIDGGTTWTQTSTLGGIYSLLRLSATTLVAATGSGMYISNDNAGTWTQTVAGTQWAVTRDPASPGTLYAGPYSPGPILRSTNSGVS